MILSIPAQVLQQMHYYAQLCAPHEVTGIGTIRASPDQRKLQVIEIFLPSQQVTPEHSQFEEGALNSIIYKLIQRDPERAEELRFRWHSHGESPTFWSPEDLRDIEAWESDWVVNMVINLKGEFLARLDLFRPLRLANIELDVCLEPQEDPDLRMKCAAEVDMLVKKPGGAFSNGLLFLF